MNEDGSSVTVISILGCDYSFKAPAGQGPALAAAGELLRQMLADTKSKAPGLVRDRLLVTAALTLCAQQLEQQNQQQQLQQQLEAQLAVRVDAIAKLIRPV
ncbi:MAG: cell division protein ZapA [Pseudomonas sp.]|jgi:cell division protein ZapA